VTETNLLQRSFANLSHSERAVTLAMHHEAMKRQGRRTDLIVQIEILLKTAAKAESATCSPMANMRKSIAIVGDEYGLSKDVVARYLRINKLIAPLKKRLDYNNIAIRTAVSLSYLSADEQQIIDDAFSASSGKLDMKKAEELRALSGVNPLTHDDVVRVFAGTGSNTNVIKPAAIKLKPKLLSQYFTPDQPLIEIEDTIAKALALYFAHL